MCRCLLYFRLKNEWCKDLYAVSFLSKTKINLWLVLLTCQVQVSQYFVSRQKKLSISFLWRIQQRVPYLHHLNLVLIKRKTSTFKCKWLKMVLSVLETRFDQKVPHTSGCFSSSHLLSTWETVSRDSNSQGWEQCCRYSTVIGGCSHLSWSSLYWQVFLVFWRPPVTEQISRIHVTCCTDHHELTSMWTRYLFFGCAFFIRFADRDCRDAAGNWGRFVCIRWFRVRARLQEDKNLEE